MVCCSVWHTTYLRFCLHEMEIPRSVQLDPVERADGVLCTGRCVFSSSLTAKLPGARVIIGIDGAVTALWVVEGASSAVGTFSFGTIVTTGRRAYVFDRRRSPRGRECLCDCRDVRACWFVCILRYATVCTAYTWSSPKVIVDVRFVRHGLCGRNFVRCIMVVRTRRTYSRTRCMCPSARPVYVDVCSVN